MEAIDFYLKDLEGKVKLEVFNLLNEVRTSKNEIAYKNLNDLYSIPELKDENIKITYYPCLQIELLKSSPKYHYSPCKIFTTKFRLPPNEYVINIKLKRITAPRHHDDKVTEDIFQILTNYGRMFNTQTSHYNRGSPGHGYGESWSYFKPLKSNVEISSCGNNGGGESLGNDRIEIILLESLPYKLPVWCIDSFNSINSENELQLQNICKDVFNIIGRWREHVTENINLNSEKMLEEINEQKNTIETLKETIGKLEKIKDRQKTSIEILDKRIEIFESKEKFISKNEKFIEEFNKVIVDFLSETQHKKMYLHDGDKRIEGLTDFFEDHSFLDKDEYHTYQTHKEEFLQYIEYKKLKRKFK
jgi:hypothetical protein